LATFPQTLIALEREAEATIVETYVGVGDAAYLTNATTTALVDEGSRLQHYRIQQEGLGAIHVATSRWTLRRDAFLESCSLALGAALARHQLVGVLDGQNAALTLDGLSLLARAQHGDHHTTIDHAQPHCESHEVFNGVFGGEARGVFNGRIIVRPGAQRTDSKQTSNNLLLSDRARADTQPQLEIYADDVKCTHGATLGPLDEMALFYLLSRGLDRVEARNALTYGFAAEILARVSDPDVRAQMDRLVRSSLIGVIGRAA
jgi:Fe-S cluster assembly protein SufD